LFAAVVGPQEGEHGLGGSASVTVAPQAQVGTVYRFYRLTQEVIAVLIGLGAVHGFATAASLEA